MSKPKLYAVMLGGRAEGCHIELHDVVFIVADSLKQAYPALLNKWFGTYKRCHIDSSVELTIVDGYEITLSQEPPTQPTEHSLYFTNFGGYREGFFGELHEVQFYVEKHKKDVIRRAKQELCVGDLQQHCDDNLLVGGTDTKKDVDDIIKIGCVDGFYIHLTPTEKTTELKIDSSYRKLDVPTIVEQAESLVS